MSFTALTATPPALQLVAVLQTDSEVQFLFTNRHNRDEACDFMDCLEISRSPQLPTIKDEKPDEVAKLPELNATATPATASAASGGGSDSGDKAALGSHATNTDAGSDEKPSESDGTVTGDDHEDAVSDQVSGLSPFDVPSGAALAPSLPPALASELGSLPVMVETTLSNVTLEQLFRYV